MCAIKLRRAPVRKDQSRGNPQQGRLACPRWPDNAKDLARVQLEGHLIKHHSAPISPPNTCAVDEVMTRRARQGSSPSFCWQIRRLISFRTCKARHPSQAGWTASGAVSRVRRLMQPPQDQRSEGPPADRSVGVSARYPTELHSFPARVLFRSRSRPEPPFVRIGLRVGLLAVQGHVPVSDVRRLLLPEASPPRLRQAQEPGEAGRRRTGTVAPRAGPSRPMRPGPKTASVLHPRLTWPAGPSPDLTV